MAELIASVPKITVTGSRIDAAVIIGATRYGISINPVNPGVAKIAEGLATLREGLIEAAKSDIAAELDDLLSPSSKAALKP